MIKINVTETALRNLKSMMAASITYLLFLSTCLYFVVKTSSDGVFDRVLGDVKSCAEICKNTFPSHTYEQGSNYESCRRGCRFYSIMEFVHDTTDVNGTVKDCVNCCKEAYSKENEASACNLGCKSEAPFAEIRAKEMKDSDRGIHMLYPLMYVHSLYSNMIDKAYQHMSVRWSFYMAAGDGKLVVIKSQPQVLTEFMDEQDVDDYKGAGLDDKTSNYWETNIEPLDNAATPMLKNSQMRSARSFEDGPNYSVMEEPGMGADWLSCIAKKTGVPRLLLCLLILFCAITMIWLCLTAAVTAPDQRVHAQKLSINGDLEYLRQMAVDGKGIQILRLQDRVEASPLPIKIRVERI